MDFEKVKQSLDRISLPQYVKFIAENNGNTCDKCRQHHGKVFEKSDSKCPVLPIHPNCRCEYQDIPISSKSTVLQEERQRIASILTAKHSLSYKQADDFAKQIICARLENKKLDSEKLFLLFNGRYLMSSDGELLLNAVAGQPIETRIKENPISATQTQEITSFVFDYSFERQGQQNLGGLPQGVYSIRCQETGSLVKGNIKKHFIGTISWGHFHWKLIPDKLTDMRGRKTDSFTIHGGNIPTSGGCIDLTGEDVKLKKYLDSTAKQFLAVYVRYDSEKIIYTKRQLRYADFFLPGN